MMLANIKSEQGDIKWLFEIRLGVQIDPLASLQPPADL
jgi:hypothetical protein